MICGSGPLRNTSSPNTLNAAFEFNDSGKKKHMVFEVRHWMTNHESGIGEGGRAPNTVGAVFYGSKGYLAIWDKDHGRYQSFLGKEQQPGPSGQDIGNNWANFIQALRTGKHEDLNAPIEEGAITDGSGENVFVVRDGIITTPPTQAGCLDGITRNTVISLARELGYTVREDNLVRTDLYNA